MDNRKKRVAVGMSGGVDSSVAAALLLEMGYDVIGITMAKYDQAVLSGDPDTQSCFSPMEKENINEVSEICNRLHIPLHIIDLREEFKEHVIRNFREEYLSGRTPNPCVVCNEKVKFGFFLEKAISLNIDFQYFATGHYARIVKKDDMFLLQIPTDRSKDQTYFLYRLKQKYLSRTIFPLGTYTKSHVRELAQNMGLGVSDKPESQDFMGNRGYDLFFNNEEKGSGDIVNASGEVLGTHKGIIHYTIGQRRGLGIAAGKPLYVIKIDIKNNLVVVGEREQLYSKGLFAHDVVSHLPKTISSPIQVKAKIRSSHTPVDAKLYIETDNKIKLIFNTPQLSVTAGQSVVLYLDDTVVGGGIISKPLS